MKLRAVTYNDDEELDSIDVRMTAGEALALFMIAGQLTGNAHRKLGLRDDESLYDVLAGVFHNEYPDGVPPGYSKMNLATLNAP